MVNVDWTPFSMLGFNDTHSLPWEVDSDVNKATATKAKAKAKALTLKAKAKAKALTLKAKAKAKATHLKAKAKTNSIIGLQDQKCQDQKYIQL